MRNCFVYIDLIRQKIIFRVNIPFGIQMIFYCRTIKLGLIITVLEGVITYYMQCRMYYLHENPV
jgi:hypothetical protein